MYALFFAILFFIGVGLAWFGIKTRRKTAVFTGILLAGGSLFFMWFADFYGELLWFESLGYDDRFWKEFWVRIWLAAGGGIFSFVVVWLFTAHSFQNVKVRYIPAAVAFVFGAQWGFGNWEVFLKYVNAAGGSLSDPVYGKEMSFYLFSLPFYDSVWGLLCLLALVGLVSALIVSFIRLDLEDGAFTLIPDESFQQLSEKTRFSIYLNAAAFILVLAWHFYLERYHLMYSDFGAITGPGWTDVYIRSWAYGIMSVCTVLAFIVVVLPPVRRRLSGLLAKTAIGRHRAGPAVLGMLAVFLILLRFVLVSAVPDLVQRMRVEPNEITFEKPYIEHNIRFTRRGFGLQDVEERRFPVSDRFTPEMVENNRGLFSNIRLWDIKALESVYEQFQEIRLYYEFQDVDIDRYTIDGKYRQVMVAARELSLENLPERSRTFVNKRFKYTHGYGMTLTDVNDFTPQGLPELLIKDIPPASAHESLKVKQPRIYYGESTDSHVIVNSTEKEFDYPSGDQNVYTRYQGNGGVQLNSFWRKFLYGWKFDGIRFLLSGYAEKESRILFRRNILERVKEVAPFLAYDSDPYIVLADGKMYWMIDAYTLSDRYPYSEPLHPDTLESFSKAGFATPNFDAQTLLSFSGANYIRNSVKCVVDAYEGTVDFYVFDDKDPLIRTWQKIFPGMFHSRDQMPGSLSDHIRYPAGILLAQGLVYAKYHMTDPEVFYNQEDLWVRATEKYYNQVVPVQPYYILWEPPESNQLEFSLIMPFTPKKRQVVIGWIAGLCDPGSYGRMIAYRFPKEKRILGPQQVETKIDQDSYLSGQLTLWNQRGSNVIRGNVLAIPVEDTLIYVEPIYLQAETAAYPELRLVAVMQGDDLSYAESFDKALENLFKDTKPLPAAAKAGRAGPEKKRSFETLVKDADNAFENYLDALGEKRFDEAADAMNSLEKTLKDLKEKAR